MTCLQRYAVAHSALLVLCVAMAIPARTARADGITAAVRSSDPRLSRTVEINVERMPIGQLLRRLAATSGVAIDANQSDGAADCLVSIWVRNAPLGDVLQGLWSLVSYRRAEWRWERSGKPGEWRYELVRPMRARKFATAVQSEIGAEFEKQASAVIDSLSASPSERAALAKQVPSAAPLINDKMGRLRQGVRLFASLFGPEQRTRLLRGGTVRVEVDRLPKSGQAFVDSVHDSMHLSRRGRDGAMTPVPPPTWIEFRSQRGPLSLAPSLYIDMEGIGGYAYLGGMPLERAVADDVEDLWILPGDARSSKREAAAVGKTAVTRNRGEQPILHRLRELHDAGGPDIMVRVPTMVGIDPGPALSGPLAPWLARLRGFPPPVLHKWRSSMLLVSSPAWIWDAAEAQAGSRSAGRRP